LKYFFNNFRKYGIKELKGDLTLEILKEKFPWILKAKIKHVILGLDISEQLIWLDGIWKDGIWHNGTWLNGTWEDGTWGGGYWYNGIWKDGTWINGIWYSGIWEKGTWIEGDWRNKLKKRNYLIDIKK